MILHEGESPMVASSPVPIFRAFCAGVEKVGPVLDPDRVFWHMRRQCVPGPTFSSPARRVRVFLLGKNRDWGRGHSNGSPKSC